MSELIKIMSIMFKNCTKKMLQRNEKTRGKACNDLEGRENQSQKRQEGFLFAVFLFKE